MRRINRRPDARRVKILRSYTIAEVAAVLDVHRNTVRKWIRDGLNVLDERKPLLVLGAELRSFLLEKRKRQKHPCNPDEMFCLRCRAPRRPDGMLADFVPSTPKTGSLRGLCPACGITMVRRVSTRQLPDLRRIFEVQEMRPQRTLKDSHSPCLSGDIERERTP